MSSPATICFTDGAESSNIQVPFPRVAFPQAGITFTDGASLVLATGSGTRPVHGGLAHRIRESGQLLRTGPTRAAIVTDMATADAMISRLTSSVVGVMGKPGLFAGYALDPRKDDALYIVDTARAFLDGMPSSDWYRALRPLIPADVATDDQLDAHIAAAQLDGFTEPATERAAFDAEQVRKETARREAAERMRATRTERKLKVTTTPAERRAHFYEVAAWLGYVTDERDRDPHRAIRNCPARLRLPNGNFLVRTDVSPDQRGLAYDSIALTDGIRLLASDEPISDFTEAELSGMRGYCSAPDVVTNRIRAQRADGIDSRETIPSDFACSADERAVRLALAAREIENALPECWREPDSGRPDMNPRHLLMARLVCGLLLEPTAAFDLVMRLARAYAARTRTTPYANHIGAEWLFFETTVASGARMAVSGVGRAIGLGELLPESSQMDVQGADGDPFVAVLRAATHGRDVITTVEARSALASAGVLPTVVSNVISRQVTRALNECGFVFRIMRDAEGRSYRGYQRVAV